jgi:adenosylcobinamide kinase/adenosylcobinamide-phosphate guanylyltransferase
MAHLTVVLGGVRSGKSRLAEALARPWPPLTYLATARAGDAEMARRIAEHQERRAGAAWRTVEQPWSVAEVIAAHGSGCLLLECLSLWLTNLLVGMPGHAACDDAAVRAEVTALREAIRTAPGRMVVVSNETGCGIMPANALARRFGDLLGEANQQLAADAAEVYWCVAGIPVRIKGGAETQGRKDAEIAE